MPTVHFANEPLPAPDQFRRLLQEASEQYDPLEKLLALERELAAYEQKHMLTSAEFHAKFIAGQTGDDPDFIGWMGRYEAYLRLKSAIAESLKLILDGTPISGVD